jgi:hypothetical protein
MPAGDAQEQCCGRDVASSETKLTRRLKLQGSRCCRRSFKQPL